MAELCDDYSILPSADAAAAAAAAAEAYTPGWYETVKSYHQREAARMGEGRGGMQGATLVRGLRSRKLNHLLHTFPY